MSVKTFKKEDIRVLVAGVDRSEKELLQAWLVKVTSVPPQVD